MGNGAADTLAGGIGSMFNFRFGPLNPPLFLDPSTGEPISFGYWASHLRPKDEVYKAK